MTNELISIVIPAFNEEKALPKLLERLKKTINSLSQFRFEIIVIENASKDKTLSVLLLERKKDTRIKILQLVKNEGCDGAIMAGLHFAKGKAAIVMMADLQDIPELIPQFIQKWKEGYDIVYGIVKKRKGIKLTRRIGTFVFYKILHFVTNGNLPENVSDFRLLDKKVYQVLTAIPEHNIFFRGLVIWTGFKKTGIPFQRPMRVAGKSKANFFSVAQVALNGIISFSRFPLIISWIISGFSLIIALVVLVFKLYLVSLILIMFGIINATLAIQGEYISRIFDEVKNRPGFIIKKTYGL